MRWLVGLLILTVPAQAGTFTTEHEGFLAFHGEIVRGDARKLAAQLRAAVPYNGAVTLMLDSPGGEYDEGVKMADVILAYRKHQTIIAAVPWAWQCSSSCVSLFAAATKREVGKGGQDKAGENWHDGEVWVHSVASTVHGRKVVDGEARASTWAWSRILKVLNVPSSVIIKLSETTSRTGARLTDEDLERWGVRFRTP